MTQTPLTKAELAEFTGTETWYRHSLNPSVLNTDGIKYLAERAGAYWLVDEIALSQALQAVKGNEFQVWKLQVTDNASAVLSCEDGNDTELYRQDIPFTDFPLPEIMIFYTDNVILLPSEY